MRIASSFSNYISGLPLDKVITFHISGGKTLSGKMLPTPITFPDEVVCFGEKYSDGTIKQMHLFRRADIIGITLE